MLDALMAWQNGPESYEEDPFFNIVEITEDEDDYTLTITGRDSWSDKSSRWHVRAAGVRRAHVSLPGPIHRIELASQHPLLVPHTEPRTELFVSNAPKDAAKFLGDLWWAHLRVAKSWIEPNEYLNPGYGLLSEERGGGMGQLAKGPLPFLDVYAEVARKHAMRPSLAGCHPPVRWDDGKYVEQTEPLYVLLMDDSWVVAERFTCERLDAEASR